MNYEQFIRYRDAYARGRPDEAAKIAAEARRAPATANAAKRLDSYAVARQKQTDLFLAAARGTNNEGTVE